MNRDNPSRADAWDRLATYVAANLGLHFPSRRQDDLARYFCKAAGAFGFKDSCACIEWLLLQPPTPALMQVLANHLTVGETYFFRDVPVLDALTTHVLPALIQSRRGVCQRLRLWSAACCTGEEAYTLAIILHRLLPDIEQWEVTVLATDVSSAFLERARAGRYGEWSFRGFPPSMRAPYFDRNVDESYTVASRIRELVRFEYLNLADGDERFDRADICHMDVVLCRNVLMYFDPTQAQSVIRKLRQTISIGGWLALAPGEVHAAAPGHFDLVHYPNAILLQKHKEPIESEAPLSPVQAIPPPQPARAGSAGPPTPSQLGASDLAAQARDCADRGDLQNSLDVCERWVAADRLNSAAHYLRAVVLLELGDAKSAKAGLQRALYLGDDFIMAQFFLGHLAKSAGDFAAADRHYEAARVLLGRLRPAETVPESGGLTAGQLEQTLRSLLSRNAHESTALLS